MRMLLLSLVPALLAAAEPLVFEVRLTGGIAPGVTGFDVSATGPGGSLAQHLKTDSKAGFAVEPQFVLSRKFTPLFGGSTSVGVFYRQHRGQDPTDSTTTSTVTAVGGELAPALSLFFSDRMWIEVGPTVSVGSGRRAVRLNGQENPNYPDGSGTYVSYGGRLGFYTVVQSHVLIGLDAGWVAFTNSDSVSAASGVTTDTTTKGSGIMANVAVGYRF